MQKEADHEVEYSTLQSASIELSLISLQEEALLDLQAEP